MGAGLSALNAIADAVNTAGDSAFQALVNDSSTGWGPPPTIEDNPLKNPENPESYKIKALHITQLRDAINALRAHYNLPNYQWQKPTASGGAINSSVFISWEPIDEMRTALNAALGPPSPEYTLGLAFSQPILADHIQELRNRVLNAWNGGTGGVDVRWLVADQLGTPRIVLDLSGSLTGVTRHDYLPFGEDLVAGGRTWANGYQNNDSNRQKFTGYERDTETALDFAQARYHSFVQGRFTSADPLMASADAFEPQSWNRYAYVINNPLILIDPLGLAYHVGGGTLDMFIREYSQDPKNPPLPMVPEEDFKDPKNRVIISIDEDAKTGRKLTDAEVADWHIRNMLGPSLASEFQDGQSGQTPVTGGLNPLYHPHTNRPPTVFRPPHGPTLRPMPPPTDLPGFPTRPHIGDQGPRIAPDQDLKYFRNRPTADRAGARVMEALGKIIIAVSPAARISPVIVCGPCMHVYMEPYRRAAPGPPQ